ncbi:glycosyltransferase [Patescibacteria group bacterium]|nr:glycosyltransferase [Patescibacteria group bacterium]
MCGMKLLVIGSDRNLFKEDSDVWNRYLDYGKLFEEIHVVVFSKHNTNIRMYANNTNNTNSRNKDTGQATRIGNNVFVYPTNHICKFFYLWNIYKITKQIIKKNTIFTSSLLFRTMVQNSEKELDSRLRGNDMKGKNDRRGEFGGWVVSTQDAFEAGLAGWMIKKIFKIPLQLQIHTDFLSPYFKRESLLNKLRVMLAKFLISRADGVRVVSERIKKSILRKSDFLREVGLPKISVLPIFVDIEKIKSAPIRIDLHRKYPQFDFIILMASRLTKEKNIVMAIEAMQGLCANNKGGEEPDSCLRPPAQNYGRASGNDPTLKDEYGASRENGNDADKNIGLVICGEGLELKKLRQKVKDLKLEKIVVFEGWAEDLISYYKTADLFLLTSNYEGYGRSIIEVMAAGLPIMTRDVGLVHESMSTEKNGTVFLIGDKDNIIKTIKYLISNGKDLIRFSENALKKVELLRKKDDYLKLYKEIIESLI